MDVTALGELVIDFSPGGVSKQGHALYERQPGGAPSNVLAAAAKLGSTTALISMVGNDEFGRYLKQKIEECGIKTEGLRVTDDAYTTLAFVHLEEEGERSFTVMRKPGADTQLKKEQVDKKLIDESKIFHVSGAALSALPCRDAAFYAAEYARSHGKIISFYANYREVLWKKDTAVKWMGQFLPLVDIMKVSYEEMLLLSKTDDIPQGAEILAANGAALVAVTLGDKGSYCFHKNFKGYVDTFSVKMVDANGAGDAFLGAILHQVCRSGNKLSELLEEELQHMFRIASACGAICTTRMGALLSMPTMEEIRELSVI